MNIDDIVVEVRDRNLVRRGAVSARDLRLEITPLFNKVGAWKLTLPSDHPLASVLREPGSGIVVTTPYDVFSGPLSSPETGVTMDDIGGSSTFNGTCDNAWLGDRLAYPQPSNPDTRTQSQDADVRIGPPETVIHGYVNANIGPAAPVERRHGRLVMGADLSRGKVDGAAYGSAITKSALFDNLDELCYGVATAADLRYRIVQRADNLVFETSPVTDRTDTIRLDVRNRTLAGYKLAVTAPTMTHAIVGAAPDPDGEVLDRLWATVTTDNSAFAANEWGRRIEKFVNQAYEDDEDAWTASAKEQLAEEGVTTTSVQAIPNDDETLRFGRDWNLGDRVTVVSDGREYQAVVTGLILKADASGVQIGAVLGDVTVFNEKLSAVRAVGNLSSRISSIERNGGGSTGGTTYTPYEVTFSFAVAALTWSMPHNQHRNPTSVQFFDNAGQPLVGDPANPSTDLTTATWFYATAGSARLTF